MGNLRTANKRHKRAVAAQRRPCPKVEEAAPAVHDIDRVAG